MVDEKPASTAGYHEKKEAGRVKLGKPRKTGQYSEGGNPPSNLILLPYIGYRRKGRSFGEIWHVWKTKLRDLDAWHRGLIADRERKSNSANKKTWEGRWLIKYRYYKVIGEEIDERRSAMNYGKNVGEILARLEFIR
jgi:hypothetical protein